MTAEGVTQAKHNGEERSRHNRQNTEAERVPCNRRKTLFVSRFVPTSAVVVVVVVVVALIYTIVSLSSWLVLRSLAAIPPNAAPRRKDGFVSYRRYERHTHTQKKHTQNGSPRRCTTSSKAAEHQKLSPSFLFRFFFASLPSTHPTLLTTTCTGS